MPTALPPSAPAAPLGAGVLGAGEAPAGLGRSRAGSHPAVQRAQGCGESRAEIPGTRGLAAGRRVAMARGLSGASPQAAGAPDERGLQGG